MKKTFVKAISVLLVLGILISLVTVTLPASASKSGKLTTLLEEKFDYADNATAKTALEKNFEIGAGGTTAWDTTDFGIDNNKLKMLGFSVLKYKGTLSGQYEVTFDYNYSGTGTGRTGRAAILFGVDPSNPVSTMFEAYPNDGATLGKTGFALYFWDTYGYLSVRRTKADGTFDFDAVVNNFSIVDNAQSSTVTITIKYDGNGKYEIYSGKTLAAAVQCSDEAEVTLASGEKVKAFTKVKALSGNGAAAVLVDRETTLVYSGDSTFAFAHRAGGSPNTAYYDNLVIKGEKPVELEEKVNETFDYADNATAKTALEKNFEIGAGGTTAWDTTDFGIENNKLKMLGFSVLKYKGKLDGQYEISFDYNYAGSGTGRTGRAAILFGVDPSNPVSTMFEAYPNDGATLGKTGFALYFWDTYGYLSVRRTKADGTFDFDAVVNNFSIVDNAQSSTVTITIKYDGKGKYEIYSGKTLAAAVQCSDEAEVTLSSGEKVTAFTKVKALSGNGAAAVLVDRETTLVFSGAQTFAFAHRAGGSPNTAYYDNLVVKGVKEPKLNTLVDEKFDYATNAAAKTALEKNFEIGVGGTTAWDTADFGIDNNKLKMLGFSVLKYNDALEGKYEISFDYNYSGSGAGRTGRAAILFGVDPSNPVSTMYEAYPNDGATLGKTGFALYFWDTFGYLSVRRTKADGTFDFDAVVNNFSIVNNPSSGTVRITIKYDGDGLYEIYSGETLAASVQCSAEAEVTLASGEKVTAFTKVKAVYGNGAAAVLTDRETTLVYSGDSTFAFAHRAGGTPNTAYYDNLVVKAENELPPEEEPPVVPPTGDAHVVMTYVVLAMLALAVVVVIKRGYKSFN